MKPKTLFCVVISSSGVIVTTEKAYTEKQARFLLARRNFYVSEELMELQPANCVSAKALLAFRRKQHRQIVREHTKPPTVAKKKTLGRQLSLLEN